MENVAHFLLTLAHPQSVIAKNSSKNNRVFKQKTAKIYSKLWRHLLLLIFSLIILGIPTQVWADIKPGQNNKQVLDLQTTLKKWGYFKQPLTGYYGIFTKDAVIKFQINNELPPTGIVNAQTQKFLNNLIIKQPSPKNPSPISSIKVPLKLHDKGNDVKILQQRLKDFNFYKDKIDGKFGLDTEKGVKLFQKNRKLKINGIVGQATKNELVKSVPKPIYSELPKNKYIVIIPKENGQTLKKVQMYVKDKNTQLLLSTLGPYIYAGYFDKYSAARSRMEMLRSHGIDARIIFK